MLTNKQYSFPQFRIPWQEGDSLERMEKSRGRPFNHHTLNTLISVGYPCNYANVDHGVFGGCSVSSEAMRDGSDISNGLIFRRHIKKGLLFAKTLTQPLGKPNMEYEWKLDKPITYPDAIEQHQYLTKRYTRNIGMFDVREVAMQELCEDLEQTRYQEIRGNILIAFGSKETAYRKYIVYATGPYLDRLVMMSLTFTEKTEFVESEDNCKICDLPFDAPKMDLILELELKSKVKSIEYIRMGERDFFGCRTDHSYSIYEANPIGLDETFKQTLQANFPTETLTADLSPHIRNEAVILLQGGLLYIVSRQESTRCVLPEEDKWFCVVFGPHPRYVVCASEKSVVACQLKKQKISCYEKLYKVSHTRIMTLSRHPVNPYILALATLTTIFLLDTRQPMVPYLSISPEMTGPIEFLLLSRIPETPFDEVRVIANNRDGELRVFGLNGGVGKTPNDPPDPPSQTEMLFQSDCLANSLVSLAADLYYSCQTRFEIDCNGSCLITLPSYDTFHTSNIVVTISTCGDLSWQQLIQTESTEKPNCVLIKPTNQNYTDLVNWMEQGKNQFFSNFKVSEIFSDILVESMEYFDGRKVLNWLLSEEKECFPCYELKLKLNTKNFPSLNKLYFQSGWTENSNWAKSDSTNNIPVLRYTRLSFNKGDKTKRKNKLEKRNFHRVKKNLGESSDKIITQDCNCFLTIDDFVKVDSEPNELPWKPISGVTEESSDLFQQLWESWSVEKTQKIALEVIEEVSEIKEGNQVEIVTETETIQHTQNETVSQNPFPEKGSRIVRTEVNSQNERGRKEMDQDYSSDPEWPMEWAEFSNTYSFSQFSIPDNTESPPSKFPRVQSQSNTSTQNTVITSTVKKTKRKIGF